MNFSSIASPKCAHYLQRKTRYYGPSHLFLVYRLFKDVGSSCHGSDLSKRTRVMSSPLIQMFL